jgi:hypothetical protein
MNNYRKTNKNFFFECAYLRNSFGISVLTLEHIEAGKWLTETEIEDFTMAYMSGGEL